MYDRIGNILFFIYSMSWVPDLGYRPRPRPRSGPIENAPGHTLAAEFRETELMVRSLLIIYEMRPTLRPDARGG